jgi:hypothetical protein
MAMVHKSITALLANVFRSDKPSEASMLEWAKTEYGNDWQYAYHFILPKISKKHKDLNK